MDQDDLVVSNEEYSPYAPQSHNPINSSSLKEEDDTEVVNIPQESTYSRLFAFVYILNLIVGVGAIAMPKAFAMAGWLLGLVLLIVLALLSYMTATYVIEAMATANAYGKSKEKPEDELMKVSFLTNLAKRFVCKVMMLVTSILGLLFIISDILCQTSSLRLLSLR